MPDELIYRALFVGLYAYFLSVRLYYRFVKPSREEVKSDSRAYYSWPILVVMMTIILGYLASTIIYILGLPWIDWFQVLQYPILLRLVGALLVIVAVPLLAWIHRELDRQYSAQLEIKSDHKLITTGPYEKVRHPMYTVLMLFSLGMALVTANALIILLSLLLVIIFPFWVRFEEKVMVETFGDLYVEYMKRTGRFFPSVRRKDS